jgi:hypothetical protein
VSHNANFDELVYRRLLQLGIVPRGIPEAWNCTADFAAYLQLDRGLDAVAPILLGEVADKTVREKMKGGGAGADESKDYAGKDARQCAWIWALHQDKWPELERYLSRLQRRAGYSGVWIDVEMVQKAKVAFVAVQNRIARQIPWANKYPVTSPKGVKIECAKRGIPTPPPPVKKRDGTDGDKNGMSLSLDDPATEKWQKLYDKDGWLEKIRDYSKAQQQQSNCEMLLKRVRKDGTVPFELIYRKAPHTARWQSGGGLRMQNLDRDDFEGFNPRWFIHARPSHKFCIADLSQIEPRTLNWDVGDEVFLAACREGKSPYDAHAISTMGFKPALVNGKPQKLKDFNKVLYALAKARLLALGYQAGPPKFVEMARVMAGITVFLEEVCFVSPNMKEFYKASQIKDRIRLNQLDGWSQLPSAVDSVYDFRNKSPLIADRRKGCWARWENELRKCVGGHYFMPLPNGDVIRYFDVREETYYSDERNRNETRLSAWVVRNSKNPDHRKDLYGGILTENRIQRIAREVLADLIGRVSKISPLLKFRWSVHDEIIAEAPAGEAKHLFEAMLHEMHTPPAWAKGLPVAAEGAEEIDASGKVIAKGILDHYIK